MNKVIFDLIAEIILGNRPSRDNVWCLLLIDFLLFSGCSADRYSSNLCGRECDTKCKNQNCDAFNGSCTYGCANSNALAIDSVGKKPSTINTDCVYESPGLKLR